MNILETIDNEKEKSELDIALAQGEINKKVYDKLLNRNKKGLK